MTEKFFMQFPKERKNACNSSQQFDFRSIAFAKLKFDTNLQDNRPSRNVNKLAWLAGSFSVFRLSRGGRMSDCKPSFFSVAANSTMRIMLSKEMKIISFFLHAHNSAASNIVSMSGVVKA